MISQTFWVSTSRFEAATPRENFINPRCFGEDFANWLRTKLIERGHDVPDAIQEDWGWVILPKLGDRKFTISIGVMDESIGQVPANWCITVAYEKPLNSILSWFKPAPADTLDALSQEVRTAMESESDFKVSDQEP